MKSKIIIFLLIIITFFSVGIEVNGFSNPIDTDSFSGLMGKIINYIFWLSFPLATLMLIIAGFYFITAAGSEKQITTGKNIILYTFVGFLIIILARGIVELITSEFGI